MNITSQRQINTAITARTKLKTVEQFENVFLKVAQDGAAITIKDVGRVELGPEDLTVLSRLDGKPGAGIGIVLADSANAMDVMRTGVSVLGCALPEAHDHNLPGARDIADKLMASMG